MSIFENEVLKSCMKLKSLPSVHKQKNSNLAMDATAKTSTQYESAHAPTRQEIGQKAYYFYLNEGAKAGHDIHHWLAAEADLNAHYNFNLQQA